MFENNTPTAKPQHPSADCSANLSRGCRTEYKANKKNKVETGALSYFYRGWSFVRARRLLHVSGYNVQRRCFIQHICTNTRLTPAGKKKKKNEEGTGVRLESKPKSIDATGHPPADHPCLHHRWRRPACPAALPRASPTPSAARRWIPRLTPEGRRIRTPTQTPSLSSLLSASSSSSLMLLPLLRFRKSTWKEQEKSNKGKAGVSVKGLGGSGNRGLHYTTRRREGTEGRGEHSAEELE